MRPHVRYVYPDHASWFYSLIAFITRALVPTRKTRMVQAYTGSVDRYDTMCAYFLKTVLVTGGSPLYLKL